MIVYVPAGAWTSNALALTVPAISRYALVMGAPGLYSQATTPDPRKFPLGSVTCPKISFPAIRLIVTEIVTLTSTTVESVWYVVAEVRSWKDPDQRVRFESPLAFVVFVRTSWGLPVGFVRLKAETVAPEIGEPALWTWTLRTLAGVGCATRQMSIRVVVLPSKRFGTVVAFP